VRAGEAAGPPPPGPAPVESTRCWRGHQETMGWGSSLKSPDWMTGRSSLELRKVRVGGEGDASGSRPSCSHAGVDGPALATGAPRLRKEVSRGQTRSGMLPEAWSSRNRASDRDRCPGCAAARGRPDRPRSSVGNSWRTTPGRRGGLAMGGMNSLRVEPSQGHPAGASPLCRRSALSYWRPAFSPVSAPAPYPDPPDYAVRRSPRVHTATGTVAASRLRRRSPRLVIRSA
jgi:hypothetical protein